MAWGAPRGGPRPSFGSVCSCPSFEERERARERQRGRERERGGSLLRLKPQLQSAAGRRTMEEQESQALFFSSFFFLSKSARERQEKGRVALELPSLSRFDSFAPRTRARARERALALAAMLASSPSAIEAAVDALAEELSAFPPSSSTSSTSAFLSSPHPSTSAPSAKLRAAAVSVLSRGCGEGSGGAPAAPGRWRKVRKVDEERRGMHPFDVADALSALSASRFCFRLASPNSRRLGRQVSAVPLPSQRIKWLEKHEEIRASRPSSCCT